LQIIDETGPSLIVTGHDHRSTYFRYNEKEDRYRASDVIANFLMSMSSSYNHLPQEHGGGRFFRDFSQTTSGPAKNTLFRFDLGSTQNKTKDVHEIMVPTCSYRMGVTHMGYGAMQICKHCVQYIF